MKKPCPSAFGFSRKWFIRNSSAPGDYLVNSSIAAQSQRWPEDEDEYEWTEQWTTCWFVPLHLSCPRGHCTIHPLHLPRSYGESVQQNRTTDPCLLAYLLLISLRGMPHQYLGTLTGLGQERRYFLQGLSRFYWSPRNVVRGIPGNCIWTGTSEYEIKFNLFAGQVDGQEEEEVKECPRETALINCESLINTGQDRWSCSVDSFQSNSADLRPLPLLRLVTRSDVEVEAAPGHTPEGVQEKIVQTNTHSVL